MTKPKLSCTMIVRDEASTLVACLESIRPHVDELVILDTGSNDESPAIAKRYADTWAEWTGCNDSEGRITDFSAARNRVLEMATGDALCWFDGDDVVRGGENLRKLATGQPGAFAWVCPYEYDRDAAGRVTTLQWRERVVYPRTGWEWRGPVHEGLLGKAGVNPQMGQTDLVVVEHRVQESRKPRQQDRNLRILESYVRKVGESDPRMLHYLGAELLLNGRIGEACRWFRRHSALAPWSDERCLSLMHLARFYFAMADYELAIEWALQASVTKSWPEPYWTMGAAMVALAELGVDPEHNTRRGVFFLRRGFELDTGQAESLLMKDPTARYDAHGWLAPALAKLGDGNGAMASAEAGLEGKPDHAELRANLDNWRRLRVLEQVSELVKGGAVRPEAQPVIAAAIRGDFAMERRSLKEAPSLVPQPRTLQPATGPLRIAFWLGHQGEAWTPETLMRDGMGGSETMAWEMARRLAKMGHGVHVYGQMNKGADGLAYGVFECVHWYDAKHFEGQHCDVLIVSRQAGAVMLPHSAKARVLWVHDVHVGEEFTPQEASRFDEIWCLSQWHREFFLSCYPWLGAGKVKVTRNGIDLARFVHSDALPRKMHKAIYSSSPDRGLAAAVAAWPRIREQIPDAELHVFYGFSGWERALEACMNVDHPHCGREALNQLKLTIAKTPGIVLRGKVDQMTLAAEMMGAGVWFYPTWFSETSCITAMEAQAAGLWCVCPPIAALAETVPNDRRVWTDDLVADVVWAMNRTEPAPALQALGFSLDALATDWDERLRKLAQQVVPEFTEAAQ